MNKPRLVEVYVKYLRHLFLFPPNHPLAPKSSKILAGGPFHKESPCNFPLHAKITRAFEDIETLTLRKFTKFGGSCEIP